jgi:hypothetical protein
VTPPEPTKRVAVGRRVFLGVTGLAALGVAFGGSIQNFLGNAFGSGSGDCCPAGIGFGSTRSPARTPRSKTATID